MEASGSKGNSGRSTTGVHHEPAHVAGTAGWRGKQQDARAGPGPAEACGTPQLPVHGLPYLLSSHLLTSFSPEPRTAESRGHQIRNDYGSVKTEESGLVISQNLCSSVQCYYSGK